HAARRAGLNRLGRFLIRLRRRLPLRRTPLSLRLSGWLGCWRRLRTDRDRRDHAKRECAEKRDAVHKSFSHDECLLADEACLAGEALGVPVADMRAGFISSERPPMIYIAVNH